MNWQEYKQKATAVDTHFKELQSSAISLEVLIKSSKDKMNELLKQQELIESAKVALEQARPLLSASSIKQLENLANTAIASIFDMSATVEYDVETKRFVIRTEEGVADLVDSNGGGLCTVISFVFDLFLLAKAGCRRFLTYDESFYAVSDQYFNAFISFMVTACHDLGIDLLCISHDARLTTDMVDHALVIENGYSQKIK